MLLPFYGAAPLAEIPSLGGEADFWKKKCFKNGSYHRGQMKSGLERLAAFDAAEVKQAGQAGTQVGFSQEQLWPGWKTGRWTSPPPPNTNPVSSREAESGAAALMREEGVPAGLTLLAAPKGEGRKGGYFQPPAGDSFLGRSRERLPKHKPRALRTGMSPSWPRGKGAAEEPTADVSGGGLSVCGLQRTGRRGLGLRRPPSRP